MSHDENTARLKRPDLSLEENNYLLMLGERIRELRARRGMTRKMLAQQSGVSERYLAQLETGHGNISIILLRQIAEGLGFPLVDIVREEPEQSPELTLLVQYLSRFPPKTHEWARRVLQGELESSARDARRQRVAFIGLRGAGKTTLGTMLAEQRGVPFLELAKVIEQEAGAELSEIFSLYGQSAYRRYERRALEAVAEQHEAFVLVAGGSIVSEPATFDLLLSSCFTIWLRASPEEHMARVMAQGDYRPMKGNQEAMEDLKRILAGRSAMYSKADAIVDTSGKSLDESFAEVLEAVTR
ncbi:helix-turn-helix transcriptional regulator [Azoarcus sp. KH32C]|uniref:helix-turn-helix transcriptional regulator n=1 Tax=Azoarcus sp. KH32C TaxID=748247 RepID=UPI0002386EC7|nr:helix-turn-helix transcriptional regulator [Azoarcus sp. KH32C]BAL24447.1 anaerobic benzoate catabolism transcriptional regulator [Azoarcus sp. KH32C]